MKLKFLFKFVVCFFIIAIIYGMLALFSFGTITGAGNFIYGWYHKKIEYANKYDSPRIFIVSGSNALYSVDTKMIENELGYPTINFGMTIELRLKYTLYKLKTIIKPEDIVVLHLEGLNYVEAEDYNKLFMEYVISYEKDYFYEKDLLDKAKFVYSLNPARLSHILFQKALKNSKKDVSNGNRLNENGDLIHEKFSRKLPLETLRKINPDKPTFNKTGISDESKECLIDFIEYCKENDIKIMAAYYISSYNNYEPDEYFLNFLHEYKELYNKNNVEILGNYEDYCYTIEELHDGHTHLNEVGREKHTKKLISMLRNSKTLSMVE